MTFEVEEAAVTVSPAAPAVESERLGTVPVAVPARWRPRRTGVVIAVGWLTLIVLVAVFAGVLPLADPLEADPRAGSLGPSWSHWFGTDTVGRDLFSRVAFGARATLVIAFCSIALAAAVGSLLGFAAGYFRGRTDAGIVMVMDAVLAFPTLVLALALTAFLGASQRNVIIAITVVATPVFGRLVRAQTLTISQRDFVMVARSTGASDGRILFTEVAPNVLPSIVAYCLVLSALAIVVEGSLSFLGIGVPPPAPTWGSTIASGRRELARAPHIVLIPTAIMFLTVLALNALGDRLRTGDDSGVTTMSLVAQRDPDTDDRPLLRVEDLVTHFRTPRGTVRALDGVSFDLRAGETLGIVGESGSGKTVLIRSILGLHNATNIDRQDGRVLLGGVDLRATSRRQLRRIWGTQIGLISQDPMVALNPVVRVGRQITEVLRHNLDLGAAESRKRAVELLAAVGIPDPERRMHEYPHQLSGGLRQRVTIAIAISCGPELLVADEPTTALDVTIQAQILALLESLQRERGMAMIFITHDLGVVAGLAHRVAVMYAGRIVEEAPTRAIFARPLMPYTEGLLAATPRVGQVGMSLRSIEGRPPDMVEPPDGCRFHPRCQRATDRCRVDVPTLVAAEPGHSYACWHPLAEPTLRGAGADAATMGATGGR